MEATGQKTEQEQTVGSMSAGEFFATLLNVLDRRREQGDPRVLDLTVKEFTEHIISFMKTRAYATAKTETEVAERILTDWSGLQAVEAVAQPCRIKSAKDATEFGTGMAAFFATGGKAEMVVAVAIVNPNGTYQKASGLGL